MLLEENMEKLLCDRVPFVAGMEIWTSASVYESQNEFPNFLDRVVVGEPIAKLTDDRVQCVFRQACRNSIGDIIPSQWVLTVSEGAIATTLTFFYSTRENAVLYPILQFFSAEYLLHCYREDYLIEEFRQFIPSFSIERLRVLSSNCKKQRRLI